MGYKQHPHTHVASIASALLIFASFLLSCDSGDLSPSSSLLLMGQEKLEAVTDTRGVARLLVSTAVVSAIIEPLEFTPGVA